MVRFIKALFYYPLMFLRPFLRIALKLFGGMLFVVALFGFISPPANNPHIPWYMIGASFLTFLIGQFYDQLLLKLNPHDTVLILQ